MIKAVSNEIFQGAILVFLVVLLFLQELKSPLIINLVIPVSVIATFNLLYFGDATLNIMSLGGLALGVGMLDDCADVVSENIFRHRSLGKSAAEAAYIGTKEVGGAVVGHRPDDGRGLPPDHLRPRGGRARFSGTRL